MNNTSIFDKKKTRSKLSLSINDNFEAKLHILNYNKCSKLLIGLTDNNSFEENCGDEINNIYAINLISGEKISTENGAEKCMDVDWEKEENLCVYLMVKNKQLFFKINEGEYKYAFNLLKDEYWLYADKNNVENSTSNMIQIHLYDNTNSDLISEDFSCKIKYIYVRKI
jgi:hypothetical protein